MKATSSDASCDSPFQRSLALFDAANAQDPNTEWSAGKSHPKELLYAERMSAMLGRFAAAPTEEVQLAVRAQHIRRWAIPRSDYPPTAQGYKQWRSTLYKFHADTAGALMREAGYDEASIVRVQAIVAKRGIKSHPASQLLEDVAALVFLEHYLPGFVARHPEYDAAKWGDILRKTLQKMSAHGRDFALSGGIAIVAEFTSLVASAAA